MERWKRHTRHDEFVVSIPERVWGGLELKGQEGQVGNVEVSIPERVWGGLERYC